MHGSIDMGTALLENACPVLSWNRVPGDPVVGTSVGQDVGLSPMQLCSGFSPRGPVLPRQLRRSGGFLLPRYGFGFNNS